ncbi:MAG: VOC family protein [Anaerolineae bacterium]|nr:VOC family protein [Anaerolineae bacterium]
MLAKNVTGLNHIALQVSSLDEGLRFFRDLLGFKIKLDFEYRGLRIVNLRAGKVEIEMWERADKPAVRPEKAMQGQGVNHIAIGVKDIDHVIEVLQSEGYVLATDIYEPTRGIREVVVFGPDHIEVQFVEENVPLLIWRALTGDFKNG